MGGFEAGVAARQQRSSVAESPQARVELQQLDKIPLTVRTGPRLLRTIVREVVVYAWSYRWNCRCTGNRLSHCPCIGRLLVGCNSAGAKDSGLTLAEDGTSSHAFHIIGAFQGRLSHASDYSPRGDDIRSFSARCVCVGSPSLGDERRSSRSDNWHGESEPRASGIFDEGRRAARRLHADRPDRFWRNRFPDSMQGDHRTTTRKGRGAETSYCGRETKRSPPESNRRTWHQRTANRQLSPLKQFQHLRTLSTNRVSAGFHRRRGRRLHAEAATPNRAPRWPAVPLLQSPPRVGPFGLPPRCDPAYWPISDARREAPGTGSRLHGRESGRWPSCDATLRLRG
jgi:hypothetical protein